MGWLPSCRSLLLRDSRCLPSSLYVGKHGVDLVQYNLRDLAVLTDLDRDADTKRMTSSSFAQRVDMVGQVLHLMQLQICSGDFGAVMLWRLRLRDFVLADT